MTPYRKAHTGTLFSPIVMLLLFSQCTSSAESASPEAHSGVKAHRVHEAQQSQQSSHSYAKRKQLPDGSWPAQHGKPPAPIPPHVHHSFNLSREGPSAPSENGLTPFGSGLRTVVLAGLQIAGMCSRTSDDWRGLLPRYIARKLEFQAEILLWSAKYSLGRPEGEAGIVKDCKFCLPRGKSRGESFNCAQWFVDSGRSAAELVVVLGSGKQDHHLTAMYEQPWVSAAETRFVHIPISHNERILENRVADFDLVLRDEEWVKPMHVDQINEFREACKELGGSRSDSFVWVARYLDWKGQTAFLESIDPKLLEGHHIHFFTSKDSDRKGTLYYDERREIERIARERGIGVTVEPGSMEKAAMLSALCGAQGAIHFSLSDANPRAVYDEILSGLPVFLSRQSRVPEVVHQQEFVVTGDSEGGPERLNEDFSRFLSVVEGRRELGLNEKFSAFVEEEMSEEAALHAMCCYMNICDCGSEGRHRHAANE